MDPTRHILGQSKYEELLAQAGGAYPVMSNRLATEVAAILNHKTGITARAWFALMPSAVAFDYAIKATRAMAGKGPTTYFLRCLVTAWDGGEKYRRMKEWAKPFIEAVFGSGAADETPLADEQDVVFMRAHALEMPDCHGCSSCWEPRQRVARAGIVQAGGRWSGGGPLNERVPASATS